MRALVKDQSDTGRGRSDLEGALEALELARWDDLPEAPLPWDSVSELAEPQGISEADVVWDLAAGKVSPKAPRAKPPRRAGRACRQ